jgi:hypothetical protein
MTQKLIFFNRLQHQRGKLRRSVLVQPVIVILLFTALAWDRFTRLMVGTGRHYQAGILLPTLLPHKIEMSLPIPEPVYRGAAYPC